MKNTFKLSLLALAVTVSLSSCNMGGKSGGEKVDSTAAAVVDSAKAVVDSAKTAMDSTGKQMVDSVKNKMGKMADSAKAKM